ncbi:MULTISPECIES: hypothetical protein [unclassified Haladaptatus]|uniref:hypothetical protein n=1 Tax=unclassified Haladaptatus TaxID=2622732 RepID=UPI0023E7BD14|nr:MULTISPECIES: hypothetical protein [unclassified Haladaptatus]
MWIFQTGLGGTGVETGLGDLVAAAVIWAGVIVLALLMGKAYDFFYEFFNPVVDEEWE